ncbi:aminotransferase [Phlyctochytrium arcticum]|nr:aminotransferase [Phlyctochytrium arcticum]
MVSNIQDRADPSTLDWANLGFSYRKTNGYYKYVWKDGKWSEEEFVTDFKITLDICATGLHYGQSCFEGLKAFQMKDGKIRSFRPELNARRLIRSCEQLGMAAPSEELFLEAVRKTVKANAEYVPPSESNGTLYIRPLVFGSGPQAGLAPATEYTFIVMCYPVGEFYKGGMGTPTKALIKHKFDRAATYGTGQVKAGGNYAPSLKPSIEAKQNGFSILLFLDSRENKYVDEFASSNFAALTPADANGKRTYVTPKSTSALLSVTNRSLCELARRHFGWSVERRLVEWEEVKAGKFEEIAACGTAVIITPVGEIHREYGTPKATAKKTKRDADDIWEDDEDDEDIHTEVVKVANPSGTFAGFRQLHDTYRALQSGELEGWRDYGWLWPAEGI